MNGEPATITLYEWESRDPADCPELAGRFLDGPGGSRQTAAQLSAQQMLNISEARNGLEIQSFSFVGRVRIGNLSITILPKLQGMPLLNLVRYAYGFRRLKLISDTQHVIDQSGIEDLLISQLNAEVQELISRGLLRAYRPVLEQLSSPRGRIDLMRLAANGGTATATLPCRHYPRIENTLLNQVLLAGLRLAGTLASRVQLRRESRKLASLMDEEVSQIRLDRSVMDRAERRMNRLTSAYSSSMSIIEILVASQGVVLQGETATSRLPGFLFDMNAFFQRLLSRFLRENLAGYSVHDEHGLKGMMRYNPEFNPRRRQSPTPRPDFAVLEGSKLQSLLDAKYRDLWNKPLPRDMLYQLVVYAISCHQRRSSILYPTLDPLAKEERIEVLHPLSGSPLGEVCLRPVLLTRLETLVMHHTLAVRRERAEYAHRLAFGAEKTT